VGRPREFVHPHETRNLGIFSGRSAPKIQKI
jgi:hypothetical protein